MKAGREELAGLPVPARSQLTGLGIHVRRIFGMRQDSYVSSAAAAQLCHCAALSCRHGLLFALPGYE